MDIDYFYSLTNLDSGLISDLWRYPAQGLSGNFLGNSSSNAVSKQVSGNNFDDFSLFLTFDKRKSSFNNKSVNLFSNINTIGGFNFGIDDGNFLFLKTNGDCYSFDNITIGAKNTLCLQKSDNCFSVYQYDIPSDALIQSQSFFVNPSVNLSGGNYILASGDSRISGINNFYGEVDQLLFLSEKVSEQSSNTIFSGFAPISVNHYNNGYYYKLEQKEWFVPSTFSNPTLQANLESYLTGIYQNYIAPTGLTNNTSYVGKIAFSGDINLLGYNVYNYYGNDTLGFCKTGNSLTFLGQNFYTYESYGSLPTNFDINVNFSAGSLSQVDSNFVNDVYFTYDLSQVDIGLRFSDLVSVKFVDGNNYVLNTGYYTGFEMNGVLVPNANLTLFGKLNGESSEIGNEAVFDSILGYFYANDIVTGLPLYLNGAKIDSTGFSFNSGKIDILNYEETSSDSIIYDKVSGLELIGLANASFSTGNYWKKTSFVATGDFSFTDLYRIKETEFLETHQYHLYYNKNWQDTSSSSIYDNYDTNWT